MSEPQAVAEVTPRPRSPSSAPGGAALPEGPASEPRALSSTRSSEPTGEPVPKLSPRTWSENLVLVSSHSIWGLSVTQQKVTLK